MGAPSQRGSRSSGMVCVIQGSTQSVCCCGRYCPPCMSALLRLSPRRKRRVSRRGGRATCCDAAPSGFRMPPLLLLPLSCGQTRWAAAQLRLQGAQHPVAGQQRVWAAASAWKKGARISRLCTWALHAPACMFLVHARHMAQLGERYTHHLRPSTRRASPACRRHGVTDQFPARKRPWWPGQKNCEVMKPGLGRTPERSWPDARSPDTLQPREYVWCSTTLCHPAQALAQSSRDLIALQGGYIGAL